MEEDIWKPENVHLVRTCCRVIYLKENYMKGEGEHTKEETVFLLFFAKSCINTHAQVAQTGLHLAGFLAH